jgi:hypothetical protein
MVIKSEYIKKNGQIIDIFYSHCNKCGARGPEGYNIGDAIDKTHVVYDANNI